MYFYVCLFVLKTYAHLRAPPIYGRHKSKPRNTFSFWRTCFYKHARIYINKLTQTPLGNPLESQNFDLLLVSRTFCTTKMCLCACVSCQCLSTYIQMCITCLRVCFRVKFFKLNIDIHTYICTNIHTFKICTDNFHKFVISSTRAINYVASK